MPLSPKQRRAIDALLTEPTIKAAAAAAKTSEQTLHRWLGEPEFETELRAAQNRALMRAAGLLKQKTVSAVERLEREMRAKTPSTGRISAADKLLNHALKFHDAVEMRARVEALEAILKGNADAKADSVVGSVLPDASTPSDRADPPTTPSGTQ